jgi:outer membrane protein TolC
MRRKTSSILVLSLALVAGPALAQTPAPVSGPTPVAMTFDEAVRLALERNPSVERAMTNIARADALLGQARAVTRPSFTGDIQNVTLNEGVAFEEGTVVPQNQFTLGVRASLPISMARFARVKQAGDQLEIAGQSATEVRRQVAFGAAEAYLAIIAARRQVDLDQRALETAQAHLDYATRRLEGGAGSRLNVARAAQEAASIEARLEAVRLVVRRAQEALGVLVAEAGPVDASGEPTFLVPENIDERTWMMARPDLVMQASIVRATQRVVSDSWKDVAPEGTIEFLPQMITPSGLFAPARTWRLTFSVTQPIYLGGLQRAVKRERESLFNESNTVLTELEIQARSEVRVAQASIELLERARLAAQRSAEQAAEVLRITTSAFEVGATTNLEVIDAQRQARDADAAAALAQDAVQRARLSLLVALGQFPR